MLDDFCPCQSGRRYAECCGPVLAGSRVAETPEELMRSRYTAFARGDVGHLRRTWAPETRPADLALDPAVTWRRLEVLGTTGGGPGEDEGWVAFAAHYRVDRERGTLRERSRFVRREGGWYYLDGVIG